MQIKCRVNPLLPAAQFKYAVILRTAATSHHYVLLRDYFMASTSDLDMLVNRLAASLKNDNLMIPAMPELVSKLSRLVGNPNLTTKELARVIGSDTGVTAQVIRMSQTLRYSNPGTTITSLPAAISRIGLNSTVSMALALAIEQSFYFRNPVVVRYCHAELARGFMICSYALTICSLRYGIMPNLVFDYVVLASALLNIGYLPFLVEVDTYVLAQGKSYSLEYDALRAAADKIRYPLGTAILRHWRFDKSFESVMSQEPDNTVEFYTNSLAFARQFIEYAEANGIPVHEPATPDESYAPLTDEESVARIRSWMREQGLVDERE